MAETIREVIVKLKIQMDRQKFPAPDFSAELNGVKQLESSYAKLAKEISRVSQAGQSVAVQMATKGNTQSGANIGNNPMLDARSQLLAKAAEQEKAYAAMAAKYDEQKIARQAMAENKLRQQAEKQFAERNNWLSKAQAQAEKQAAADEKRMEKAEAAAKRHAENLAAIAKAGQSVPVAAATAAAVAPSSPASSNFESYTKAGDAYRAAGEGAFTLARGVALLTSANEKDLTVMIQRIAAVQGYFDVARGGLELTKGVTTGTRALAVAHSSAAVAASIQAGTTGGLTVALIAARGAALTMWAALTGPVGLAVLGTTAAVGGGYLAWQRYGGAAEAAAEKTRLAAAKEVASMRDRIIALRELSAAQLAANEIQNKFSYASQLRGLMDANPAASFLDKLRATQEASQADRQRSVTEIARGANFAEGRKPEKGSIYDPAFIREQTKSAEDYFGVLKKLRQENSARSFVALRMGRDDKSILNLKTEEERTKAINQLHEQDNATLNAHASFYDQLTQAAERQLTLGREKLKLLGDEETRLKGIKSAHDANAKSISDARKALAAGNLSDIQKFAQLSQFEQEQIRNISERVGKAGGDLEKAGLAKHEVDLLRQTGLSESNVQRFDLNRGLAGGAADVLKKLGSQNVTAIEATLGKGQEGDSRGDVLDFQQQRANAGRNEINQALMKIREGMDRQNEEIANGLKELSNIGALSDIIKTAIRERDESIARLRTELAQQGKVIEAEQRANKYGRMSGREG